MQRFSCPYYLVLEFCSVKMFFICCCYVLTSVIIFTLMFSQVACHHIFVSYHFCLSMYLFHHYWSINLIHCCWFLIPYSSEAICTVKEFSVLYVIWLDIYFFILCLGCEYICKVHICLKSTTHHVCKTVTLLFTQQVWHLKWTGFLKPARFLSAQLCCMNEILKAIHFNYKLTKIQEKFW